MPKFLEQLVESPVDLALFGVGLAVWAVWLRRRSKQGPAELSQLPTWDVWWLEIIFFCFTALWFQIVVSMGAFQALKLGSGAEISAEELTKTPLFAAISSLASPTGFLLAWWTYPKMLPRRPPPPPTEHRPLGWGRAFLHAAVLYAAWFPVLALSMVISGLLMPEAEPQDTMKAFLEAGIALKIMIFVGAAIGAPIAEELVFRGRIYRMLKSRLSLTNAAALGSLFFALIHSYPVGWLSLFLFSLMLTYAYERHGSLKVSILLHAMNNGLAFVVMLLAPLPAPKPGTPETPPASPALSPADSR